eukprot:275888-Prorocentrum_minimum.AAC.5
MDGLSGAALRCAPDHPQKGPGPIEHLGRSINTLGTFVPALLQEVVARFALAHDGGERGSRRALAAVLDGQHLRLRDAVHRVPCEAGECTHPTGEFTCLRGDLHA